MASINMNNRRRSITAPMEQTLNTTAPGRRPSIIASYMINGENLMPEFGSRRSSFVVTGAQTCKPPPILKNSSKSTIGSTKANSIASAKVNWIQAWFLTFADAELEQEYQNFFLEKNLSLWRVCVLTIFFAGSILYLFAMVKIPKSAEMFKDRLYSDNDTFFQAPLCPPGWLCTPCTSDVYCDKYSWTADLIFYLATNLVPAMAAMATSFICMHKYQSWLSKNLHHISSLVILFTSIGAISARFSVVDASASIIFPGFFNVVLFFFAFIFMRVRFITTIFTSLLSALAFILLNYARNSAAITDAGSKVYQYSVSSTAIVIAALMVACTSYEMEKSTRMHFLSTQSLQRTNTKLANQLKAMQRSNTSRVMDLDSPLDKSIAIVKSVILDASTGATNVNLLGQLLSLLTSTNLHTPDFDITSATDENQENWLTSEVIISSARRRKQLTQATSGRRRRPSQAGAPLGKSACDAKSSEQLLSTLGDSVQAVVDELSIVPNVAKFLAQISEYNFPIFDLQDVTAKNALAVTSMYLFKSTNLLSSLQIPVDKLKNWILAIQHGYRSTLPYHNSLHATDVLHCINYLSNLDMIKGYISELDILAIYIAAIIHDYDHPGVNNAFLIATGDAKAVLYNDKSVLENHHVSSAFKLLAKPEMNFLSGLSKADFKNLRETVIEMVLATDLSQHFPLLNLFKNRVQCNMFDPDNSKEDRSLLYKIIMKLADVSNPTKEFEIYERWYKLVVEEFFMQGDMEKKLGLPVSAYMDRNTANVPAMQAGFIDFIVHPLFSAFNSYCPTPIMETLEVNREKWATEKEREKTAGVLGEGKSAASLKQEKSATTQTLAPTPGSENNV